MPAAAGVDTTAIIVGDYSNGNDAVLTRNGVKLKDLPGKKLLLVEKTVSQYLFERGMALNGLESQIKQVRLVNTSDSDIAAAFLSDTSHPAVVTWKPLVSQIAKAAWHHQHLQLLADPRRDSRSHRRSHRCAQSSRWLRTKVRESSRRRLVRNHGAHVGQRSRHRQSARRHRRRLAGHAGILQRAAQHHASALHAAGFARSRHVARNETENDSREAVLFQSCARWEKTPSQSTTSPCAIPMAPCKARPIASVCASKSPTCRWPRKESSEP